MAIEALVGNNALLWVNTGTVDTPVWEVVALQRGLSDELTREMIDASHKGSDFAKSVPGRQSGTVSLEALVPDPDFGGAMATHDALEGAMNDKQPILIEHRKVGSQGTELRRVAEAQVGTIASEYPDNDVSTISVEFTMQEPFTAVP